MVIKKKSPLVQKEGYIYMYMGLYIFKVFPIDYKPFYVVVVRTIRVVKS